MPKRLHRPVYVLFPLRALPVPNGRSLKQIDFSRPIRSEEHTSELQSLMRISYAVFCLKKKKHIQHAFTLELPDSKTHNQSRKYNKHITKHTYRQTTN